MRSLGITSEATKQKLNIEDIPDFGAVSTIQSRIQCPTCLMTRYQSRISTGARTRVTDQSVHTTAKNFTDTGCPNSTLLTKTPCLTENRWTDGPAAPEERRRRNDSSSSDSTPTPGIFTKLLICQASVHKNPRRSHNTLFMNRLSLRRKQKQRFHRRRASSWKESSKVLRPIQNLTSYAVQRIPSALRLRRTQSAPRLTVEDASSLGEMNRPRKHSSNPSIGSPLTYTYELPNFQYQSDSSVAQYRAQDSMRACGRGDLLADQYCHEEFHHTKSDPPKQAGNGSYGRVQSESSFECGNPLIKIVIQGESDDESSGSEMLRDKKRKSIISEAGTADHRVVERFKPRVQDECEDNHDSLCSD
ncbi:hypothetical protein IQ07DRAFT_636648 [Pyrenochaeta sp. DS3sAY3a]|nr:hypothetical protein IQ07DRAFT_636648 [Pyrenochaeta sp. DS3sAY3a]